MPFMIAYQTVIVSRGEAPILLHITGKTILQKVVQQLENKSILQLTCIMLCILYNINPYPAKIYFGVDIYSGNKLGVTRAK